MIKVEEKRRTYSIAGARSLDLARASTNMTEQLERTVTRQSILDALVVCLEDKVIFNKVKAIIKKS